MTFLALAIMPRHGILGKSVDGESTIYVDRHGQVTSLSKGKFNSIMSKSYYLPLKLTRVVTPEQAVSILNTESDEYAKLYE